MRKQLLAGKEPRRERGEGELCCVVCVGGGGREESAVSSEKLPSASQAILHSFLSLSYSMPDRGLCCPLHGSFSLLPGNTFFFGGVTIPGPTGEGEKGAGRGGETVVAFPRENSRISPTQWDTEQLQQKLK